MNAPLPLLAVTMGDPSGTGPELITRAAADPVLTEAARLLVVGDAVVLRDACRLTRSHLRIQPIDRLEAAVFVPGTLPVLDLRNVEMAHLQRAQVQAAAGKAAYEYIHRGTQLCLEGKVDAMVTSAINKEALNLAGFHFDGHTGLLKELCGGPAVTMMLVADNLRVGHVSTHVPLSEAIQRVRPDRILEVLRLLHDGIRQLGIGNPRLAVAGLNPHASEGGLFGAEESEYIQPAVVTARRQGLDVSGPFPGDTIFFRAWKGEFDGVVAMYHDQGHVAAKMLGIWQGVNVTLGLPIIRTSVEHGTDFTNAGKGTGDPRSLIHAIRLAARMARNRSDLPAMTEPTPRPGSPGESAPA